MTGHGRADRTISLQSTSPNISIKWYGAVLYTDGEDIFFMIVYGLQWNDWLEALLTELTEEMSLSFSLCPANS